MFWQKKAWADRSFSVEWFEKVWAPFVKANYTNTNGKIEENVLFLDNLSCQIWSGFRDLLKTVGTCPIYFPPNMTDMLQPIDAGPGRSLKYFYNLAQEDWLLEPINNDRWSSGLPKFSASERRILSTHWLGKAVREWKKKSFQTYFRKTGCLITLDKSGDELIRPEKLDGEPTGDGPKYDVTTARNLPTLDIRHGSGFPRVRNTQASSKVIIPVISPQ